MITRNFGIVCRFAHDFERLRNRMPTDILAQFKLIHIDSLEKAKKVMQDTSLFGYTHINTPGYYLETTLQYLNSGFGLCLITYKDLDTHPEILRIAWKDLNEKMKHTQEEPQQPKALVSLLPLEDRLIVKEISSEVVRKSGIIIPATVGQHEKVGIIQALGIDFAILDDTELQVRDTIRYSMYGGTDVEYKGIMYTTLRKGQVLAKCLTQYDEALMHDDFALLEEDKYGLMLLEKRVMVKPDIAPNVSKEGTIIIPDAYQEKSVTGTIMLTSGKTGLNTTQRVLYSAIAGTAITIDEEKYLILRESEIIAIVA